jgi:hypothetical protein
MVPAFLAFVIDFKEGKQHSVADKDTYDYKINHIELTKKPDEVVILHQ